MKTNKGKMKVLRYVLPALVLLLAQLASIYTLKQLSQFDYTLVTFQETVTWNDVQTINSTFGRIADFAIFTRTENVYITDEWGKSAFVTIYGCSEMYFSIADIRPVNGRVLWDSDSNERAICAVIDHNLAVRLFAGKDCLGETINVGDKRYTIVGVCTAEDGVLTSVDEYAIYLPMDEYVTENTKSGCLFQPKNDIDLAFALQGGVAAAGGIQSVDNLKMRADMRSMPIHASYFAVWIMALVCAIKIASWYFDLKIRQVRSEMSNFYLGEYIKKNIAAISLHIATILILCGAFVIWYRAVRFTVKIDASLIPRKLINISEWLENIKAYMRYRNSAYFIPFSPSHKVSLYGKISLASSVVHIFAAWELIKNFWRSEKVSRMCTTLLDKGVKKQQLYHF